MAGKVQVTPGQLRAAADLMADLRDDVRGVLTGLKAASSAHGAPWGEDGYGTSFAGGETGYLVARENMFTAIANMAATLDSYADGQRRAVTLLEKQDRL
ncbi:hypothetical protein [Nocardia sp. NPDC060259]|uniref:hypothetical protein n=1 Tax=Nocardia sp. NPDC060259 TaxID=3347088 RepID=UPI003655F5D1